MAMSRLHLPALQHKLDAINTDKLQEFLAAVEEHFVIDTTLEEEKLERL